MCDRVACHNPTVSSGRRVLFEERKTSEKSFISFAALRIAISRVTNGSPARKSVHSVPPVITTGRPPISSRAALSSSQISPASSAMVHSSFRKSSTT